MNVEITLLLVLKLLLLMMMMRLVMVVMIMVIEQVLLELLMMMMIGANYRKRVVTIGLDSQGRLPIQVQQLLGAGPRGRTDIGQHNPIAGSGNFLGDHLRFRNRNCWNACTSGHFIDVTKLLLFLVDVILIIITVTCGNYLKLRSRTMERLSKPMEMIHVLQLQVIILANLVNRMTLVLIMIRLEALFTVFPLELTHCRDLVSLIRFVLFEGNHYRTTCTSTGHYRERGRRTTHFDL